MGLPLNQQAWEKLVDEDLEWLDKQARTLERDAWAYLAGKFPRDGLGGYFSGIVERMDAEKPTPRPANKQRKEGE